MLLWCVSGYWLAAAPDNYVNEEWFGITAPIRCGLHKVNPDGVDGGYHLDSLYLRPAYLHLMHLWSGNWEVDTSHTSCAALQPCWHCSITHTIEQLNDGACLTECRIPHLEVGPGSSQPKRRETFGSRLLKGPSAGGGSGPVGFLSRFWLLIAIGVAVIVCAIVASLILWHRRGSHEREAMAQPLIQQ